MGRAVGGLVSVMGWLVGATSVDQAWVTGHFVAQLLSHGPKKVEFLLLAVHHVRQLAHELFEVGGPNFNLNESFINRHFGGLTAKHQ